MKRADTTCRRSKLGRTQSNAEKEDWSGFGLLGPICQDPTTTCHLAAAKWRVAVGSWQMAPLKPRRNPSIRGPIRNGSPSCEAPAGRSARFDGSMFPVQAGLRARRPCAGTLYLNVTISETAPPLAIDDLPIGVGDDHLGPTIEEGDSVSEPSGQHRVVPRTPRRRNRRAPTANPDWWKRLRQYWHASDR